MLSVTEVAGFVGAGLAGAAYVPQIWHLVSQHCSAGLSRVAFSVWLVASVLVTSHAIAIHATVFIVLGAIQLTATALILVFTITYAESYCATHLPVSVAVNSTDPDTATQTQIASRTVLSTTVTESPHDRRNSRDKHPDHIVSERGP